MAYKKYIKRDGKVYGPYIYHSRKVNGKVISEYRGKASKKKSNKILIFLIIALITAFLLFSVLNYNKVNFEEGIKVTKTIFNSVSSSLTKSLTGLIISEDINESEKAQLEKAEETDGRTGTSINDSEEEEIKEELTNETSSKPQNITDEESINETIITENETEQITQNYSIETNFTEQNITINETNETSVNVTNATEMIGEALNKTPTNVTETNLTIENITQANITIQTTQYQAILGQPVKWKKQVIPETTGRIKVPLPREAENISVNKIKENITSVNKITGGVISESIKESVLIKFLKKILGAITGKVTDSGQIENEQEVEVEIDDIDAEYEIEYFTDAPYSVEADIEGGKRITIIGPENLHYENVLSFTDLDESLHIINPSGVKIYWIEESKYIPIQKIEDKNSNGIYDYIEWTVPVLSNQTFEIIVITKAEHLDENRTFISDIYEEVRELDDIWSEEVSDIHYVRITFERNLTSENDITLYPRIVSGNPKIEVYGVDENEIIATFDSLTSNEYNKVYLTNLQGEQDTFDLKVIGGSIEIDYIVDPEQLGFEDFEAYQTDTTTTFTKNWTNDAGDNCQWGSDKGGTASSNTGPGGTSSAGFDHTLGTTAGIYIYLETSTSGTNACGTTGYEAWLVSDQLDADTYAINVSFWYHMYGATIGSLHVDVYHDSAWENSIWSLSGQQHTATNPYSNAVIRS